MCLNSKWNVQTFDFIYLIWRKARHKARRAVASHDDGKSFVVLGYFSIQKQTEMDCTPFSCHIHACVFFNVTIANHVCLHLSRNDPRNHTTTEYILNADEHHKNSRFGKAMDPLTFLLRCLIYVYSIHGTTGR